MGALHLALPLPSGSAAPRAARREMLVPPAHLQPPTCRRRGGRASRGGRRWGTSGRALLPHPRLPAPGREPVPGPGHTHVPEARCWAPMPLAPTDVRPAPGTAGAFCHKYRCASPVSLQPWSQTRVAPTGPRALHSTPRASQCSGGTDRQRENHRRR